MKGMTPEEIYRQSFTQIRQGLDVSYSGEERCIIERIIHATADWEYRDTVRIHPTAVKRAVEAIRLKSPIITDVTMVLAGFNHGLMERTGVKSWCYVNDPETYNVAPRLNMTRAAWGIKQAARIHGNNVIVVIANAPTALLEALRVAEEGWRPHVIIGVPVGFVMAKEAKESLTQQSHTPYITNLSEKGGSPVGAAIVNALLQLAGGKVC